MNVCTKPIDLTQEEEIAIKTLAAISHADSALVRLKAESGD